MLPFLPDQLFISLALIHSNKISFNLNHLLVPIMNLHQFFKCYCSRGWSSNDLVQVSIFEATQVLHGFQTTTPDSEILALGSTLGKTLGLMSWAWHVCLLCSLSSRCSSIVPNLFGLIGVSHIFPVDKAKKGLYTYTAKPYKGCIPVKNSHFFSYTNTYTNISVAAYIHIPSVYQKNPCNILYTEAISYTNQIPHLRHRQNLIRHYWSFRKKSLPYYYFKSVYVYQIFLI